MRGFEERRRERPVNYAAGTKVPVEKSRAVIERLITKYGATEFSSGWMGDQAAIQFMANGRRVRFVLDLPNKEWAKDLLMAKKRGRYYSRDYIPTDALVPLVDAEHRRRWRCLLLAIKAKLEVVHSGIASFDEEFLAHIVMPDDETIYDHVTKAAANGRLLLPPVAQ